jgi:putative acetyltransferase
MTTTWTTRVETDHDVPAIRSVTEAAFPTPDEARIIDALRADPTAWLPGLSLVCTDAAGRVTGHAVLSRCTVGGAPALALGPCSATPEDQRRGAGTAVIRAALEAAREAGERLVVVLGHPRYYPRFGFLRASTLGIRTSFEVPDEALMALDLQAERAGSLAPLPQGVIVYPAAFGV